MSKETIPSRAVLNFYSFLNSGSQRDLIVNDPITGRDVLSENYFDFVVSKYGMPNENSYYRIIKKRLPNEIASVYSLLRDKEYAKENINLSWRDFIDLERFENIIQSEFPEIEPVKASSRREYHKHGQKILQISNGLRRIIFYPYSEETQGRLIYIPDEYALRLIDIIYNKELFIYDVMPTITKSGDIRIINQEELRQKFKGNKSKGYIGVWAKVMRADGRELDRMIKEYLDF